MSRVITALGGPAGWLLLLLSICVLTVTFERARFWLIWWRRRNVNQQHWKRTIQLGGRHPEAWLDDRDMEMRFAESFLESMTVIGPLVGLIGTVFALRHLLSILGPQLLLPPRSDNSVLADVLTSTAVGLLIGLLATVTLHLNMAMRHWQLTIWRRDLHEQTAQMCRQ